MKLTNLKGGNKRYTIYLRAKLTQVTNRQDKSPQVPPRAHGNSVGKTEPQSNLFANSGPDPGSQLSYLEEQLIFCYSLNGLDEEVTKRQPLIYLLFHLLEHKGVMLRKKEPKNWGTLDWGSRLQRRQEFMLASEVLEYSNHVSDRIAYRTAILLLITQNTHHHLLQVNHFHMLCPRPESWGTSRNRYSVLSITPGPCQG